MSERKPKARKKRTRRNRDAKPYKRSSDGKWVAIGYWPNGKRKACYGDTADEAEEKRRTFYREVEEQFPITVGRTDTVEQYIAQWLTVTLPQRVAAGRLAASTLDSYREKCELHIVPHLGRVKLVDLGTVHIRQWLLELTDKPSGRTPKKPRKGEKRAEPERLSARTQAYCFAILRKALNDAVDDELIRRNPALKVKPPVVVKKEFDPLTKDEVGKLLGAAAGDRLWAYWLVVLALGLRRGEGLGLRWDDLNFDERTANLQLSVQRVRGEVDEETGRRRGQLVSKSLKTSASKATMALPDSAVEALKEHRKAQKVERLAAKVWVDEGLVFATTVGTPIEPRNVNRAWDALCDRAGVRRVRVHDLRHACASLLLGRVDLKVIQATLRHTRMSTTADVYLHVLGDVQREAADGMDAVLRPLIGKTSVTPLPDVVAETTL
jgi:integrase